MASSLRMLSRLSRSLITHFSSSATRISTKCRKPTIRDSSNLGSSSTPTMIGANNSGKLMKTKMRIQSGWTSTLRRKPAISLVERFLRRKN